VIYATPSAPDLSARLAELDELRAGLREQAGRAGPWLGDLRRRWRAQSAESSIEIEGFRVPEAERLAVADGSPADLQDDDRLALSCYARAMDHVGVMAGIPTSAGRIASSSTCTSTPAPSRGPGTPAATGGRASR
jgi:hypothetical protein